jgi:hypothetical protein
VRCSKRQIDPQQLEELSRMFANFATQLSKMVIALQQTAITTRIAASKLKTANSVVVAKDQESALGQ